MICGDLSLSDVTIIGDAFSIGQNDGISARPGGMTK